MERIYQPGCKDDVFVCIYPLPGINELVRKNEDGSYTILISETLQKMRQLEALNHAIRHIVNEDWTGGDVNEIERKAHDAEKKK